MTIFNDCGILLSKVSTHTNRVLTKKNVVSKMALSDRKLKILEAIITDYIETAEPIGSRTIAKKYDLGISPATVRNEMSDLEEMGLIEQPHTSAGRIPSDKGYRLYVDNMMQSSSGLSGSQAEYLAKAINYNVTKIEYLMQQTAKAISMLTNYTAVVSEPVDNQVKVKHIQLVPVDERSIVAVIVTSDNTVKNSVIKIKTMPDTNTLAQISKSINSLISNVSLEEINREFAAAVFDVFPEYQETIAKVLKVVISDLRHNRDVHLYTSGVRNMLGFPEFNDLDKIKNIFQTFEEKEMLVSLLGNEDNPADKVQILIGNENSIEELKDCSVIRANYKFGNNSIGRIGIVGPTRMNYSQTVSVLNEIVKTLDNFMSNGLLEEDDGGYDG